MEPIDEFEEIAECIQTIDCRYDVFEYNFINCIVFDNVTLSMSPLEKITKVYKRLEELSVDPRINMVLWAGFITSESCINAFNPMHNPSECEDCVDPEEIVTNFSRFALPGPHDDLSTVHNAWFIKNTGGVGEFGSLRERFSRFKEEISSAFTKYRVLVEKAEFKIRVKRDYYIIDESNEMFGTSSKRWGIFFEVLTNSISFSDKVAMLRNKGIFANYEFLRRDGRKILVLMKEPLGLADSLDDLYDRLTGEDTILGPNEYGRVLTEITRSRDASSDFI